MVTQAELKQAIDNMKEEVQRALASRAEENERTTITLREQFKQEMSEMKDTLIQIFMKQFSELNAKFDAKFDALRSESTTTSASASASAPISTPANSPQPNSTIDFKTQNNIKVDLFNTVKSVLASGESDRIMGYPEAEDDEERKEELSTIRSNLQFMRQWHQMMGTDNHLLGLVEYRTKDNLELPLVCKTMLNPDVPTILLSQSDVDKLKTITTNFYAIFVKMLNNDKTLIMISDDYHSDRKGPFYNSQPFLMFHFLYRQYGTGDSSTKLMAYTDLFKLTQGSLSDAGFLAQINNIGQEASSMGKSIDPEIMVKVFLDGLIFEDTYKYVQDYISDLSAKNKEFNWSPFMKFMQDRERNSIHNTNKERPKRSTGNEGALVANISSVNNISSDRYLRVGDTFQQGCLNCLSLNHTVELCKRICMLCFLANIHQCHQLSTHSARDCVIFSTHNSKSKSKSCTTQSKNSSSKPVELSNQQVNNIVSSWKAYNPTSSSTLKIQKQTVIASDSDNDDENDDHSSEEDIRF